MGQKWTNGTNVDKMDILGQKWTNVDKWDKTGQMGHCLLTITMFRLYIWALFEK
ncbi:MAG TPA: hypothetical protein VK169_21770 [Saprospiraceae bacterium]|nr:hypothetical protein [Saprospiraceae bacterium]